MKKLFFLLLCCGATHVVFAQRNCGTPRNLEYLSQQDPGLKARHLEYESRVEQWIRDRQADHAVRYPAVKGFQPSGDPGRGKEAYARAKAVLYADQAQYAAWKQSKTPPARSRKEGRPASFKQVDNR